MLTVAPSIPDIAQTPEGFSFVMKMPAGLTMSEDQFFEFCQVNGDLRFERTAQGDIIVMPPTGWESSEQNGEIYFQLRAWTKRDGTGLGLALCREIVDAHDGRIRLANREGGGLAVTLWLPNTMAL